MSEEDFIYSAIADDNVNAFDLNVIANTLASTDKLVRQNKQQREENEGLREKISSLRESALQIKTLYETEVAKTGRAEAQLANYVSQCQQLEQRCLVAENERINTGLLLQERIAEYDRQMETNQARYRGLVCDLVRYYPDQHQQPSAAEMASKWKDLKVHSAAVEKLDLPDEVKAFFQNGHPLWQPPLKSKRRKRPEMHDQACQTIEDMVVMPRVQNCGTNTEAPYQVQQDPPIQKKTFCDKGTMHSTMSTITRSTCTSAFIKHVDVGVNFPEVTHKSVDEILRECVPLPPLLLSPITEILPLRGSVETQTDFPHPLEPEPRPVATIDKPRVVSCGTITSLKNIRKRIDYRTIEGGGGVGGSSFQQQYISIAEQLYANKIKKEEHMSSMASPGPNIPVGFGPEDTFGRMHPHLSTIWTLLGETIFSLMGSPTGRRFDGQCYGVINEQLATIREMIEADGRRESELMSAMFSNVSATVEAAAGYGKERTTGFPVRPPPPPPQPAACFRPENAGTPVSSFDGRCQGQQTVERREQITEIDDVPSVEKTNNVPCPELSVSCPSKTKEISNEDHDSTTTTSNSTVGKVDQPLNVTVPMEKETRINVAQSNETVNCTAAVRRNSTAAIVVTDLIKTTFTNGGMIMDEENDRIAQELRLMEEGNDDLPFSPTECALGGSGERSVAASIEDMLSGTSIAPANMRLVEELMDDDKLDAIVERIDGTTSFADHQIASLERPSTPPRAFKPSSSSTATFVSPIKVKETNDLVKDQFKTPTQPPISKRKLRIRRSDEQPVALSTSHCSKRQRLDDSDHLETPPDGSGRLSPTTEFLLEDDWDQKFSSIKAAMFPSIEGTYRPLSPIIDCIEQDEAVDSEWDAVLPLKSTVVSSIAEESGAVEKQDESLVGSSPVEIAPNFDRIKNSSSDLGENGHRNNIDGLVLEVDCSLGESFPVERRDSAPNLVPNIAAEQKIAGDHGKSESIAESDVLPNPITVESIPQAADDKYECPQRMDVQNKSSHATTLLPGSDVTLDEKMVGNGDREKKNSKTSELNIIVDVAALDSPESPVWDSPMSPPAHETGCTAQWEMYCRDSPLSPPLVSAAEIEIAAPPKPIPLDHITLQYQQQRERGPIDRAIECYKLERRFEVVNLHAGRHKPQEQAAMQTLSEILQCYIQSPWTEAAVAESILQILAVTHDARTIALSVLETVVSRGDIIVNVLCSPPAPPIPVTQQKLVLLVRLLTPSLNHESLDRVLMRELDRRVFQLKSESTVPLPGLIALTFLYIGLEDSKPAAVVPWHRNYSVRLYLFKCLYYFGYKCLPLVYYVLRAFPFALPKKGSPHYDNADAMISTIRTILMNINYSEGGVAGPDAALYKKRELFGLLTYQYGYQPGSPTYEELVVNLVEKIRANRLRNVPYALILVAKRKSYEWARQHIIQNRLHPLLNDYLKLLDLMSSGVPVGGGIGQSGNGCELAGLDERIVACIFTISSIMKTHPSHEDVSGVMQIFTTIVQLARGHQAIQEAAIAGLVKFSRFGHADIFERVSHWRPTYPVSDRIKLMLATLIHRKDLRFWKQLIQNKIV